MRAYITRFAFPRNLFELCLELEKIRDTTEGMVTGTDLERLQMVHATEETVGTWTLPKHVFVGDLIFFQYTLSGKKYLRTVLRELAAYTAQQDALEQYDWAIIEEDFGGDKQESIVEAQEYLQNNQAFVSLHFGKLVASALVHEKAFYEEYIGLPRGGNIFAPYGTVHFFDIPIAVAGPHSVVKELPEFSGSGPLLHRAVSSNEALQTILTRLRAHGNILPTYLQNVQLEPSIYGVKLTRQNWRDYVPEWTGFIDEAQVRQLYTDFLLQELKTTGPLYKEVGIVTATHHGRVDYVINFHGLFLPIEVKVNIKAEPQFLAQIAKYTGPATLYLRDNKVVDISHPYVLAIDQFGIYLLKDSQFHHCDLDAPLLKKEELKPDSALIDLIAQLKRLLNLLDPTIGEGSFFRNS